jgi:hypothetical protein
MHARFLIDGHAGRGLVSESHVPAVPAEPNE